MPLQHHDIYYKAYQIANKLHKPGTAVTDELRRAITDACIKFFVAYEPFKGLSWFKTYLTSPLNGLRPKELVELEKKNPDKADLCTLAKACIHLHLRILDHLLLGKEFGASIHVGDMTAAPRHDGRPSSAHFTDAMLVSALTIQKALEIGVPREHLEAVAKGLQDEHESGLFKRTNATFIEKELQTLLKNDKFRMKDYTNAELVHLLENLVNHPWLVERYLTQHALLQNKFHGSAAKSTPAEMALGFNLSLQMSAFVGIKEMYSVLLSPRDDLLDTEFVVEVLAVLMERSTRGYLMEDRSSPKAFFAELAQKNLDDFTNLRAFFDKGLFANFSPEELIQGALDVAHDKAIDRHGITWDNEKTIRIPAKLDAKGATLAGFPLRQTTGRDYPELEFTATCAFFLGKKVTLSGFVQTAMRARKLLIPNGQKLIWCVMKDLWDIIAPESKHFDVEKAARWGHQNWTEELHAKILERAYQGIDAELHAIAWKLVRKGCYNAENMLSVLCPPPNIRPWHLYDKEHTLEKTDVPLQAYVSLLQDRLGLHDSEISNASKVRISTIIKQTAALIEKIYSTDPGALFQTGFQNHEQEHTLNTNLQMRDHMEVGVDKRAASETYGKWDSLQNIATMHKNFYPFAVAGMEARKLPKFFMPSQERLTPRNDWSQAVKPLSHMLIVQEKNKEWSYYALTEAGVRFYVDDIAKFHTLNPPETRACVAAIGKSVLTSTWTMTSKECENLLNTDQFNQIACLLNVASARAFDSIAFVETLHKLQWTRSDYRAFCQYIRASLPPTEDFAPEKYERELFG